MPKLSVEVGFSIERSDLDHLPSLAESVAAAVYYSTRKKVVVNITKPDGSIYTHPEFDEKRHDGNI